MPLPQGTKYRWKKMKSGKMVRLAFDPEGDVIETKSRRGKARVTEQGKKYLR